MKVAVLIDGGFLRHMARCAGHKYNPDFIEAFARQCIRRDEDEFLFRVLYYDCPPYTGTVRLPVSGASKEYSRSDEWLHDLSRRDLIAVRRGVLKFRGFNPKRIPVGDAPLEDKDFESVFEQKGVDMRIGLDIALFSSSRSVERIILVSNDTDCIPAMKHGRKAGLQVVIAAIPDCPVTKELLAHCDYRRAVAWPPVD